MLFFVIMNWLTGQKVDGEEGTLSMIDRKVVDAFLRVTDAHRHYLYILRFLGFRQTFVDVEHAERFAGTSGYNLRKMFVHALDGITSQSTRLLHASSALGFLFVVGASVQVLWLVYKRLILDQGVEGWASAMVSTWFIGGMVLFSLGVLGLYVGKMFEQTKNRPLYIVAEVTEQPPGAKFAPLPRIGRLYSWPFRKEAQRFIGFQQRENQSEDDRRFELLEREGYFVDRTGLG